MTQWERIYRSNCEPGLLGNEGGFHLLSARTNYKVLSDPGLIEYRSRVSLSLSLSRSLSFSLKQDLILHPREISGQRDHRDQK